MSYDNPKKLTRLAMTKDEELIYILKHGHAPTFRIEHKARNDGSKDEPLYLEYFLTNIPKEDL